MPAEYTNFTSTSDFRVSFLIAVSFGYIPCILTGVFLLSPGSSVYICI